MNKGKSECEYITLDVRHGRQITDILKDEESIDPTIMQIRKLKAELSKKKLSFIERLNIHDDIYNLKKKVRIAKKRRLNYHLDNAELVFSYFEHKKNISTHNDNKRVILNNFFNIKESDNNEESRNDDSLDRYLLNNNTINPNSYILSHKDVCERCHKGELVIYDSDGILVCTNCSNITKYIIEHEKCSYKEPPKEACFYAYKRINHFREILAQFQAKESTQIPEQVIENFKMQIKKERITLDRLTNKKAKEILKKLNYSKYYEHVPFIKDKIGIKPPVMNNALEETLCNLFLEIQAPYAKYCPDYRVNFLNYYYTIYKLCELLNKHEFLEYFPMLKDKAKRIEQDNIWKNICKELNWQFIPTN